VRLFRVGSIVLVSLLLAGSASLAWNSEGHRLITSAALETLDIAELPISASAGSVMVASSVQPDLMRPLELSELRSVEAPRHYIDLERLKGRALPERFWDYSELLARRSLDPEIVGTLPYAVVESTYRLAALFAQLRRRPGDTVLMSMAMHQAGQVAHYAQDLCQPLHTTIHHDGRVNARGRSPRSGIHRQVDALPQLVTKKNRQPAESLSRDLEPLFQGVVAELEESHSHVDAVFDLAADLQAVSSGEIPSHGLQTFAGQRFQRAVSLTADLVRAAWNLSAEIRVPGWAATRSSGGGAGAVE